MHLYSALSDPSGCVRVKGDVTMDLGDNNA